MKMQDQKRTLERQGKKLSTLLEAFYNYEASFTQRARSIRVLFQALKKKFPSEPLFGEYDHHLKSSLPYFENIYANSHSLFETDLSAAEQVQRVSVLYSDELYYRHLAPLILLYPEFDRWGGEIEYAFYLKEARLFPSDVVEEAAQLYSPLVFFQQLDQLGFYMKEFCQFKPGAEKDAVEQVIDKYKDELSIRMRKRDVIDDISRLFQDGKGATSEDLMQAINLYLEGQIYRDPTLGQLHQRVKEQFPACFRSIFYSLFKQIEQIKLKIVQRPAERFKAYHQELKHRLINVLEYSREFYASPLVDFDLLEQLSKAVLVDIPLSQATFKAYLDLQPERRKLALIKIFTDFSSFSKEEGFEDASS